MLDPEIDRLKRLAAERAVEDVREGMVVGLGTGSTAAHAVRALGRRVRAGLRIVGVPSSRATEALAGQEGIALSNLVEHPTVDLTIDGADEIDPQGQLIKGRGGALVREKILASRSRCQVIVADGSKRVERLGAAPVPVEVIPFGWRPCQQALENLGAQVTLRRVGHAPFSTDNGNYILDCRFGRIDDPVRLETAIKDITGVVDSGLFINLAHRVIIASSEGIEVREVQPVALP